MKRIFLLLLFIIPISCLTINKDISANSILKIGSPCYFVHSFSAVNSSRSHTHDTSSGYAVDLGANGVTSLGGSYLSCHGADAISPLSGIAYTGVNSVDGNYIEIVSNSGITTRSSHLANFSVTNGQRVLVGQKIGTIGVTGATGGFQHIHFEVRHNGTLMPYYTWQFTTLDNPVVGDFDGDGIDDPATIVSSGQNSNTLTWIWWNSRTNTRQTFEHGDRYDIPVPGDYDGDGRTDLGIYRSGLWIVFLSSRNYSYSGRLELSHGNRYDLPIQGDYDGDRKSDIGIYRNGLWIIFLSSKGYQYSQRLEVAHGGDHRDQPLKGDFDGDTKLDLTIYRSGQWVSLLSSKGYQYSQRLEVLHGGLSKDIPVIGDFEGDGRSDITIYRNGSWISFLSSKGYTYANRFEFVHGDVKDIPLAGKYKNLDNKSDLAIYRDGTWIVLLSDHSYPYNNRIERVTSL